MYLTFQIINQGDRFRNNDDIQDCVRIAENNKEEIKMSDIVVHSDLVVVARGEQDNVVGYAAFNVKDENVLDLISIAVDCDFKGAYGIGCELLDFAKKNSKPYSKIESKYRKENVELQEFFKKNKFEMMAIIDGDKHFVELAIDKTKQETDMFFDAFAKSGKAL